MKSLARDLRPIVHLFLAERWRLLLTGAMLAAITTLAGMALLGLSGWFITATGMAGLVAATAFSFDVFAPSAGIRLLALARTAARYGERLTTHDATLRVLAALRERLFRSFAEPGAARSLLLRPARLLFRLTADIDALDSLYLRVLIPAAAAAGAAVAISLALGYSSPLLGLAAGLFLLLSGFGIPLVAGRLALAPARRRAHAQEALRARVTDLVAGQTELIMSGMLPVHCAAIAAADRRLAEADGALNRIDTGVVASFGISSTLLIAGTLLAVAALAGENLVSPAVAALGVMIALAATEPFAGLRRGALELGRTALAARRLGPKLKPPQPPAARPHPPAGLAIRLDAVSVHHERSCYPALTDISLDVRAGERIALVGASGAGKSALMALVAGEIEPSEGRASSLPATLLTQRTELFQDSLRDNLKLASPDADDRQLQAALAAAGLADDIDARPEGLDLRLGEGGMGLSGGQSRRLALARLFLRDTPVWLLDEPTEGLDGETARDVIRRLSERAGGRTLVIATHIRREATIADRIVMLDRGQVVATARRGDNAFDDILSRLRPD